MSKETKTGRAKKRLRSLIRVPRRDRTSVEDLLLRQIDVALRATELANAVCSSRSVDAQKQRKPMRKIEHEGDDARATLVDRMGKVFTVSLEREDLFRVSRSIDDVTDHMRDLVREMAKWDVTAGAWSRDALLSAEKSLRLLRKGIASPGPDRGRAQFLAARAQAGRLRRRYEDELETLFAGDLTMDTLKKREILRRFDSIGTRLNEAVDGLLDGLIKRYL